MMSGKDMIMLVELMRDFEEYLNMKTDEVDKKKIEEKAKKLNGVVKEFETETLRMFQTVTKNIGKELKDFSKAEIKAFVNFISENEGYESLERLLNSFWSD